MNCNTTHYRANSSSVPGDPTLILAAIILPPLAVGLVVGATKHFWINLVLCFLLFVPAQIHAIVIVVTKGA